MARAPRQAKGAAKEVAPQPAAKAAPKRMMPDNFEAGIKYRVKMKRPVQHGGMRIMPQHEVTMEGAVAELYRDSILWAEPA